MGKKNKQQRKTTQSDSNVCEKNEEALQKTLEDFTSKENWDKFFTLRGSDDTFEWYAEWPQLESLLTTQLSFKSREELDSAGAPEVSILVPGCGNSKLSEHLYDAGFKNITNVDFSKVVISDMLSRNVRLRPEMKWRVMDMTSMQFANETFDAIVDKGGLDALMEPKLGSELGYLYLFEVKRIIKAGGKYVCLTLAEAHVLDLLFLIFRFGWKMSLYSIPPSSRNLELHTFMVVAEKDSGAAVSDISLFMDKSVESHGKQACDFREALEREKKIRLGYSNGSDISYSLQDLHVGAKGNISAFEPGRRVKVILGGPGVSSFVYNGILLDAKEDLGLCIYQYAAFIVPHRQAHDWLFSSQEGQWLLVVSSKSARLLMIILDSSNSNVDMEHIQMDLSPLVRQLAPGHYDDQIPFLASGDGMVEREIVHQVTSAVTGPIVVEDVVYQEIDDGDVFSGCKYRRLTFKRTENLVQSEALLSTKGSNGISNIVEKDKDSKPKNTENWITSDSPAPSGELKVVHNHLASSYHTGIISGILLISSHLKVSTSVGDPIKAVVIGLGAGLLPMFMKNYLPGLKIEVVELDPVVLHVAREYFGFVEDDENLKVHITDGIEFVKDRADGNSSCKVNILVVDVDSADTSSGLTCPAPDFVEESFLLTVRDSLSEQGLFIINLVSRSSAVKHAVKSRMQKVFSNVFTLQLEKDVNEVIFAVKTDSPMKEDQLSEARDEFAKSLLEMEKEEWKVKVGDLSKSINLMSL
ncbi:hypothetical protein ACS0TY_023540 [Phlomoides rotata]